MAPCQAAKHSLVKEVFVKAEIYSQSMLTQMSNTLCLKLKLASALHLPNLGLAALFIKTSRYEWMGERFSLFLFCFVTSSSSFSCLCCIMLTVWICIQTKRCKSITNTTKHPHHNLHTSDLKMKHLFQDLLLRRSWSCRFSRAWPRVHPEYEIRSTYFLFFLKSWQKM